MYQNERFDDQAGAEEFEDKTMVCRVCGKEFTWTAKDQAFYKKMNFNNPPKDCWECRKAKKDARNNQSNY